MKVFVGLGSNLGHRFDFVRKALRLIAKDGIEDMRVSVMFETKAILLPGSPASWDLPYLNLVVSGNTSLSPHALLKRLKEIERELGRDLKASRWAPRVIDLDILAYDDLVLSDETLTIPHPELMNRPFLVGLTASLQPDFRYPAPGFPYSGLTLCEILHRHVRFDPEESKCLMPFPQMVGIVNVTPDSFSDGGNYFSAEKALQRIQELTAQGAAVIDLGAQSTRPGAVLVSPEEEWRRLQPVLSLLAQEFQNRSARPKVSLDSTSSEVFRKALLLYPLDWINDVSGGEDLLLLQLAAEANCTIVLSHSLTVPASKQSILPFEKDPAFYLRDWAEKKIEQLKALGIFKDKIILDPGIGFGKTPFQSLSLLRNIDCLQQTGCEVLVGHSRKSFLKILSNRSAPDTETVGVSHYLMSRRVDYLRVHNVEAHQRSLTAHALLAGSA